MFSFPSLSSSQTRCWLNLEQSGGQERDRKPQLRKELRVKRDFLKNNDTLKQKNWGRAHFLQLFEFLREAFPPDNAAAQFWTQPWAAYFPIGSELQLLGHCPMEQCWLPHALPDGSLHWYRWQSGIELWPTDKRSLPQPPASVQLSSTLPVTPGPILMITPCIAVDRSGTRLGYGGGYYDRFLSEHSNEVLAVACVPQELRLPEKTLPKEPHDIGVDVIVTEHDVNVISQAKIQRFFENKFG